MVIFPLHSGKSNHPELFLGNDVLKIYSKFTGEHPCRSMISVMLLCNITEITLRHECSPVNLLHIFRTPFLRTPLMVCGTVVCRAFFNDL